MTGATVVPLHGAKYSHVSNAEFLQTIFGDYAPYVHVTAFGQPPDQLEGNRGVWAGGWWKDCLPAIVAEQNSYFVISLFTPGPDQKAHRRRDLFSGTYVLVVDDVGLGPSAKVHPRRLSELGWPEPSYKLETSPDNAQWGYLLDDPCTNRTLIEAVTGKLVKLELCPDGTDPGMLGVTRYVRLPQGINNKTKYMPEWKVRLNEWNPSLRFSIADLAQRIGVDPNAPDTLSVATGESSAIDQCHEALNDWPADPVLDALDEQGLIVADAGPGRFSVLCPNRMSHSDRTDEAMMYFRNGAGGKGGGYKCWHGSCEQITSRRDVAKILVKEYTSAGKLPPLALTDLAAGVQTYGLTISPPIESPRLQRRLQENQLITNNSVVVPVTSAPDVIEGEIQPTIEALLLEAGLLQPTCSQDVTRAREIVQSVATLPVAEQRRFQTALCDRQGMNWTTAVWNATLREVRGGGDGIPPLLQIEFDKYVYVARANKFVHKEDLGGVVPEAFRALHHKYSDDAAELALSQRGVAMVDQLGFDPSQPRIYNVGGVTYLNGWTGLASRGMSGDIAPWTALVERLIPAPEDREHVLDWMAFTLQHPETKINHAILMQGPPGCGKDTMFYPLVRALGEHAQDVSGSELGKNFTWYLARAKLVLFQEVDIGGGHAARAIANDLKSIVAAPPNELSVNCKNLPQYKVPNLVSCVLLTNEVDSLFIGTGDRRFFVLSVPFVVTDERQRVLPEYAQWFANLWRWYRAGGWQYVVDWLLQRDVSRFEPGLAPPVTEAKQDLLDHSRSDLGSLLHEMQQDRLGPFVSDLVLTRGVYDWLLNDGYALRMQHGLEKTPTKAAISRELAQQWPGLPRRDNKDRYRIVRKSLDWHGATPEQITAELDKWRNSIEKGIP